MALTKKLDKEHEFNVFRHLFEKAYFKIDGIDINPIEQFCNIHVGLFASEESRRTGANRIFKRSYYKISFEELKLSDVTKAQEAIYNWLKTLDECKGCKDC